MKKLLSLTFAGVCILAALGFYAHRPKTAHAAATSEPVAEPTSAPAVAEAPRAAVPAPDATASVAPRTETRAEPTLPTLASPTRALDASFLGRTVDILVSSQSSYQQKQEAWKQLRDSGKLDQAITELEQRTANDPRAAAYPATLGQAYLQKCGTIQDVREQGILAMQADKMFDTALNLDPANWEARFTKAVALSYWPPMLNKGDEVIQHFQTLIQQQEAQAPQPQFAQSYAWLGDQYQKAGRSEDARMVWERGVAYFPTDEKLRAKLASKP